MGLLPVGVSVDGDTKRYMKCWITLTVGGWGEETSLKMEKVKHMKNQDSVLSFKAN